MTDKKHSTRNNRKEKINKRKVLALREIGISWEKIDTIYTQQITGVIRSRQGVL